MPVTTPPGDAPVVASLAEILAYRNRHVVESFQAALGMSQDDAEQIFAETLRFLWLSATAEDRSLALIDGPILIIDEMWHTFILFTRHYHEFCYRYFGRYLHHSPTTEEEKAKTKVTPRDESTFRSVIEEKRHRYHLIYDILGRETFLKWYHEFPERFSVEAIRMMRKK